VRCEIRVYHQHDADLSAIADAGYKLSAMFKDAILAFANSEPLTIKIDPDMAYTDRNRSVIRCFIYLDDKKDQKAVWLLNQTKPRMRAQFIKAVLRSFLVYQQLNSYLTSPVATENIMAAEQGYGKNIKTLLDYTKIYRRPAKGSGGYDRAVREDKSYKEENVLHEPIKETLRENNEATVSRVEQRTEQSSFTDNKEFLNAFFNI